jgi:hypothetical protein
VDQNSKQNVVDAPKQEWVMPEVRRFEAGSAESQRGNSPDGGGGFQGS